MRTLGDTPRPLPKGCALWTPAAPLLSLRGVGRRGNLGRGGYTLMFSVRASKVPSGSWTNS